MRILVTGGAGFLGSHLCEHLLLQGHEVICMDNLYTGKKANILPLLDDKRFEFIRHDVTVPFHYEVDLIYNLACPASPYWYQKDPVQTIRTCVQGAMNVLEVAKKCGATVLQASTSEVYGDPEPKVQKESYWGRVNPIGPRSCYDEGKRCAESLFMAYSKQGTDTRIARIFNTYGPRMSVNDGRVVSNLVGQAIRGWPMSIYGDGKQTRSFCHVSDMVQGLVALMESNCQLPVNLGNPKEVTMIELANIIRDLTNSKSKLVYKPLPEDDPKQRKPDISRARALGWKPMVSLHYGLRSTIDYFTNLKEN